MNLSAVILTKNEEINIKNCIDTLEFADEIVVVDDNSADKTVDIAKGLGAKVYQRELGDDFAAQRNFGLIKAKGKWALFLDADERVSKALAREMVQITNDAKMVYKGFYLRREDLIWGRQLKHGETGSVKLLRMARKGSGEFIRRVHEVWEIAGPTSELKNPLFHYPHPTLKEFIKDINRMSGMHAQALLEERKRSSIFRIVFWPPLKFLLNWFLKLGFLDGIQGFVVALTMSFHSFLAWSKLWLLQKRT